MAIDIRALSIGLFLPLPIVFFVLSNQRLEESLEDKVVRLKTKRFNCKLMISVIVLTLDFLKASLYSQRCILRDG